MQTVYVWRFSCWHDCNRSAAIPVTNCSRIKRFLRYHWKIYANYLQFSYFDRSVHKNIDKNDLCTGVLRSDLSDYFTIDLVVDKARQSIPKNNSQSCYQPITPVTSEHFRKSVAIFEWTCVTLLSDMNKAYNMFINHMFTTTLLKNQVRLPLIVSRMILVMVLWTTGYRKPWATGYEKPSPTGYEKSSRTGRGNLNLLHMGIQ